MGTCDDVGKRRGSEMQRAVARCLENVLNSLSVSSRQLSHCRLSCSKRRPSSKPEVITWRRSATNCAVTYKMSVSEPCPARPLPSEQLRHGLALSWTMRVLHAWDHMSFGASHGAGSSGETC